MPAGGAARSDPGDGDGDDGEDDDMPEVAWDAVPSASGPEPEARPGEQAATRAARSDEPRTEGFCDRIGRNGSRPWSNDQKKGKSA
jgi:hypothetical protein